VISWFIGKKPGNEPTPNINSQHRKSDTK